MKRSPARPRWLAGLVLGALAVGLAGCGAAVESEAQEPTTEKSPEAVVQAAAENTAQAESARISVSMTMELPGEPEPVTFTMEGESTLADTGPSRFTVDLSDLLSSLGAGAEEAEAFMPTEMIMVGTLMYMRMPALADLTSGDKEWIRMDIAEIGKQEGIDIDALLETSTSQDPTQILSYLRATSDNVQELGREDVRGVETTHYRATVDLRKTVQDVPPELRDEAQRSTDELIEQLGSSSLEIEVWIDAEGLARRFSSDFPLPAATGSSATLTFEMYDFGVELDIEVPSEDDVIDYTELVALGG